MQLICKVSIKYAPFNDALPILIPYIIFTFILVWDYFRSIFSVFLPNHLQHNVAFFFVMHFLHAGTTLFTVLPQSPLQEVKWMISSVKVW